MVSENNKGMTKQVLSPFFDSNRDRMVHEHKLKLVEALDKTVY